jgi:hypothetical protein
MLNDLTWLTKLDLPAFEPKPPTLFDILGVATRETVNSNVLAYYLKEDKKEDKKEDEAHGLGRLFLDTLLDCMRLERDKFPSPYTVERETNFIDILIRGEAESWAIILENKIFHFLDNPLDSYWDSVNVSENAPKVGVVVTLKRIWKEKTGNWVNITHEEWLKKVKDAVPKDDQPPAVERQRLLFSDFLTTMENNTAALMNDPKNNKAIRIFQENHEKIAGLLKAQTELQKYIQDHLDAVFAQHGFDSKQKNFYYPDEKEGDTKTVVPVRFFVVDKILMENRLEVYFELFGEAAEKGLDVRTELAGLIQQNTLNPGKHHKLKQYYHLAYTVDKVIMTDDSDFPDALKKIVDRFFNQVEPELSLVERSQQKYLELTK